MALSTKDFIRKGKGRGSCVKGRKVTKLTTTRDGRLKSEIVRTEIENPKSGEYEFSSGKKKSKTQE